MSSVVRNPTSPVLLSCESTSSLRDSYSPHPLCEPALPIHESTPPTHEPTPPAREQSPLPPPRVKMSLKEFALCKRKQRKEMANKQEQESTLRDLSKYITKDGDPVARSGFGEIWKCTSHIDRRLILIKVAVKALQVLTPRQQTTEA
ncbi:hypothetical protein BDR03DRAFT_978766 [Suillus americanus]|nr:hypothetical protein BDR03DRAFT_978766 [Suillus americanus]